MASHVTSVLVGRTRLHLEYESMSKDDNIEGPRCLSSPLSVSFHQATVQYS